MFMLINVSKKLLSFKIFLLWLALFCQQTHADCWRYAEQQFGIDHNLLAAIAEVESGMDPSAVAINRNGTTDYGLMQINSIHLKRLNSIGIDTRLLKDDPCVSVLVGASILSDMVRIYGLTWEAVGAYNAGPAKSRHALRMKYARKVQAAYQKRISQ